MVRALIDRLPLALLVLLGVDGAALEHQITAIVVLIVGVVDAVLRVYERRAGAQAVLRARDLPPLTDPASDEQLAEQLRRAGITRSIELLLSRPPKE